MGFGSLSSQQRVMVLLELLGGPKYTGEMKAAAAQTTAFGKSVEVASRRTFIANQALYTMRRYAFYSTTAIVTLTAVVGKLGYGYLSAMQTARVALGPVIKDHAVLEGYLTRLFKISKYSPFVITDLALSFRKMVGGFQGTGVGPGKILNTIGSLTDYLSVFGKVGPGSLNRVTQALIHMANVGRLTGRAVYQLGSDGLPIYNILHKELGLTHDQLKNIAKINIPAGSVLDAILKYRNDSKLINGAALRISLRTFSGLMQVGRDSLSQLSGAFIGSSFKGGQSWLYRLLKPGGPMDQLSSTGTKHGGQAAIMLLSKQLTGHTGLGQGFMLLLSLLQNIAKVFAKVFIPAIVMGAHALILLYPILKVVNWTLGFMAKHSKIFAVILSVLAAEFILFHGTVLLGWVAMRLFNIATFGALISIPKLIGFLRTLRAIQLVGLTEYATATVVARTASGGFGLMVFKNTGIVATFTRYILRAITALKAYRVASIAAGFATLGTAAIATGGAAFAAYGAYESIRTKTYPGIHPTGDGRSYQYARDGKTYQVFPGGRPGRGYASGSMISPTSMTVDPSSLGDTHLHTHVYLDKKQIAEAVTRVQNDKKARR